MNSDYIKMCKEAKEIQDIWLSGMGNPYDRVVHIANCGNIIGNMNWAVINYTPQLYKEYELSDFIWLPRQEDLQRIADDILHLGIKDLGWNYYWFLEGDGSNLVDGWLEFVMVKCFNKTWNWEINKWVEL